MFQFPALASIIDGWYLFKVPGCPIRKSADRRSFAPPRGLSQLITSFIASESQGIRHAPFSAFFRRQYLAGLTYTFRLVSLLVLLSHHVIDRRNIPATLSRKGLAAPILLFLSGE